MATQDVTIIDGYTFLRPIGSGKRGIVYLAIDNQNSSRVAIKAIQKRIGWERHYQREVIIGRLLSGHKNISFFMTSFEDKYTGYIVTEYINHAIRLSEWMPLSLLTLANVFSDLVDAVAYIHSKGVVHSDIKNDNILIKGDILSRDEGLLVNAVPIIIDFDLACIPGSSELPCFPLAGTPNYISPEAWNRSTRDPFKADIYALGITFYFVINRDFPYPATSIDELQSMLSSQDPISSNSAKVLRKESRQLDQVIMAMIDKDPDKRISLSEAKALLDTLIKEA